MIQSFFPLSGEKNSAKIGGAEIEIELADTLEERIRGLSGRAELPPDRGMLFIYDQPDLYGIWMKDMNFPIDIIWFGPDKKIAGISENVKPESFPEIFKPPEPVNYILEVNAGFADNNGIKTGDEIEWR